MSTHFVDNTYLQTHVCGDCGILFAAPAEFWTARHKDRRFWSCPNGHQRYFTGPSEADKLRAELERQKQMLQAANARAGTAELNLGQVAKAHRRMRERVMNGVCPCCNRTFQNLRDHMASEHPEFAKPRTLYALRHAFGMTQADVGREAGVDTTYVSFYERDKKVPEYARQALDHWIKKSQTRADA